MTDDARDELAELTRMFAAHLEWQRELGLTAAAVSLDVPAPRAPAARARIAPASPPPAPEPSVEAPPKIEVPVSFRKRPADPPPPRPAAPPPAAVAPKPAPVPVAAPTPVAAPSRPAVDAWGTMLEGDARLNALTVLRDDVAGCTRCRLHEGRTQTVFARGNPFSQVAFVGEGPGRDEDLQGAPFVGAAGQLLDQIIGAMGLTQDEVYICNVVKCRPPNNRVPAPDEMVSCGGYLVQQLGFVRPQLIVALGKTAASYLLESTETMSRLRGRWHSWQGIPLLPTWHPAYLLRTPSAKKDTWEDMKLVLQKLGRAVPRRGGGS